MSFHARRTYYQESQKCRALQVLNTQKTCKTTKCFLGLSSYCSALTTDELTGKVYVIQKFLRFLHNSFQSTYCACYIMAVKQGLQVINNSIELRKIVLNKYCNKNSDSVKNNESIVSSEPSVDAEVCLGLECDHDHKHEHR